MSYSSKLTVNLKRIYYHCVYDMWVDTWHEAHVEVGGQLSGLGSLFPPLGRLWGSNPGHQACTAILLPTQPSHWPLLLSVDWLIDWLVMGTELKPFSALPLNYIPSPPCYILTQSTKRSSSVWFLQSLFVSLIPTTVYISWIFLRPALCSIFRSLHVQPSWTPRMGWCLMNSLGCLVSHELHGMAGVSWTPQDGLVSLWLCPVSVRNWQMSALNSFLCMLTLSWPLHFLFSSLW